MAGLAFGFKSRGCLDVTKCFLVLQALRGWKRRHVIEDHRHPVSIQLLQDLGARVGCLWESLFRLAFLELFWSFALR